MKIYLSEALQQNYPEIVILFIAAKNIVVEGPSEKTQQILEDVYPNIKEIYSYDTLKSHPHSQAYTQFAKSIGISPDSAFLPYLQINRVLNGKMIGNINNIVNKYMAIELKYNISVAAYDFDTIGNELVVDLSKGGEEFTSLGGHKVYLKPNDFVFLDDKGILYSFSEGYRDSSKVTSETKNVLFAIDAPKGVDSNSINKAVQEFLNEYSDAESVKLDKSTQNAELKY